MAVYYCELKDVQGVLSSTDIIQLAADENDEPGVLNQKNFDDCRESATSEIRSYLMVKYPEQMPFATVPNLIRTIAKLLTKYYLYERKNALDETLTEVYDNQVEKLEKLAKGTLKLGEFGKRIDSDGVTFTKKEATDRPFHINNMGGYL